MVFFTDPKEEPVVHPMVPLPLMLDDLKFDSQVYGSSIGYRVQWENGEVTWVLG